MTDNRKLDGPVKYDFDFDEAMQRIAQTNPNEVTELVEASAEIDSIDALIDRFEAAGHDNGRGDKCWFARDLQSLLGYAKWDKFESVIDRAQGACRNAGHPVEDHFVEVFPHTGKNPLGGRPGKDFELSRYACYLIAQNASSRLKPVAFAQTYFAIQTRRQELTDREGIDFDKLSENQKRLYLASSAVCEPSSGLPLDGSISSFFRQGCLAAHAASPLMLGRTPPAIGPSAVMLGLRWRGDRARRRMGQSTDPYRGQPSAFRE